VRHPWINYFRQYSRVGITGTLVVLFCAGLTGCAGIPTSPLSRPQGIGTARDAARNDPDVFFFEDFENENYANHFSLSSLPRNRELVEGNVVFNGNKSMRITVNKNSNHGSSLSYRFAKAGMEEPSELYARYYLRFDDSWKTIKGGGKLPGAAGKYGKGGWGGRRSNGKNGWSARMTFKRSWAGDDYVDIGYYTYYADMPKKYGSNMRWNIDNRGTLEKNRWYCIETYVRLNTPGEHDGILRGWVDGYLAMEKDDIMFRTIPDLRVEEFWLAVFYGGGWRAPKNMSLYIDNLALSTKPIGTAIQHSP
jgi:hypothetical protein